MKDELELDTTTVEDTESTSPFSFRFMDEETIQLLIDDKIATGG